MAEEKIIIRINEETGEIDIETKGILGPSCFDEVDKILKDNATVYESHKTDEYYRSPEVKTRTSTTLRRGVK